jgi:hypothetical protein
VELGLLGVLVLCVVLEFESLRSGACCASMPCAFCGLVGETELYA